MGWSHSQAAGKVMDRWTKACLDNSDIQNQWSEKGKTYFFETTCADHEDGAICGSIWRFLPNGTHVRRSGTFRINGDGTIQRAPKFLKYAT